jgi:hypothetical protein
LFFQKKQVLNKTVVSVNAKLPQIPLGTNTTQAGVFWVHFHSVNRQHLEEPCCSEGQMSALVFWQKKQASKNMVLL